MEKDKQMRCLMCEKNGEMRRSPESGTIVRLALCDDHWNEYMVLLHKGHGDENFSPV